MIDKIIAYVKSEPDSIPKIIAAILIGAGVWIFIDCIAHGKVFG